MRLRCSIVIIIALFCSGYLADAAEFDGFEYDIKYTALSGDLSLYFDIEGQITDLNFQFDVEENMPSSVIPEYIDQICEETSPDYNPQLCEALTLLFTTETLNWLDAQWNQHLNTGLTILPSAIETRQLPWPVSNIGSIFMVDYQLDWPCLWNTQSGEYENIPLEYGFDTPLTDTLVLTTDFALNGSGQIQRDNDYSISGLFDFDSGLVFTGENLLLDLQFGLTADYQGLN